MTKSNLHPFWSDVIAQLQVRFTKQADTYLRRIDRLRIELETEDLSAGDIADIREDLRILRRERDVQLHLLSDLLNQHGDLRPTDIRS